ncbi:hypothetical protein DLE60_29540 [Micromonospora globispora]|nr:hypothetical protein DLE60_29540 [Micromonospora globispora]RQX06151.1 hypothetical protein DKL51_01715 [Micromonospora globispora]
MPSPGRHTTRTGVAVAVTDIPGTDAVAERLPHVEGSTHHHTGSCASTPAAALGFLRIAGAGSRSRDTATRASASGSATCPSASHTTCCEPTPSCPHVCSYQAPGPAPAGGTCCCGNLL